LALVNLEISTFSVPSGPWTDPWPGSLSLWGFATSADLLGISLPTTFLELDDGACGPSSPLRGEAMP